ncbi:MAG: glycosyltransferase [Pseudomonadota bacterium]
MTGDPDAPGKPASPSETSSRTILAYSDKLFTPSESFIPRGYSAFSRLRPVFIGHELKGPVPPGTQAIPLGRLHGPGGEAAFKQLGTISPALEDALRALNPIAIHASFGKSGAYALPLARKLGLPLAVTYYGGDATKTTNTKDSWIRVYNRRRQALWDEAALILPCSDFIRRELLAKGAPANKLIVHHNTADPARFQPGDKQKILLFAGRWTEKKGIDTLIAALARIAPQLAGWRIRLLGDGDLKPALVKQLEAAGIEAELPGWINADDMPEHFAEAMIVCVPSKRAASGDAEGLPLVCVEAMLSGCALAATRHAGITECVKDGETGYLVDEGDDEALAERLSRMLADETATRAMGDAGRQFALTDFNLTLQSQRLEDHLFRIAEAAGTL